MKKQKTMGLTNDILASLRLDAVKIAAGLPEPEPAGQGMMATSWTRPGKTAEKVIADAEKIVGFITRK